MEQILTHSAASPFFGRGRIGVVARGFGLFCADIRATTLVFVHECMLSAKPVSDSPFFRCSIFLRGQKLNLRKQKLDPVRTPNPSMY